MNDLKWYQKLLIVLLIIICIPIFVLILLIAGICTLFQRPRLKKIYKSSQYYKDFGGKFCMDSIDTPEYRFYNSAVCRNLPMQYARQENGFEYVIYGGIVYLFPGFDQIDYDNEKEEWQVGFDGTWISFDEMYKMLLTNLDDQPKQPIKLLVERRMFPLPNLNGVAIPECIYLTWSYESAFENEDSPLKMILPQNSKELYEMMLQTPDLCGKFELSDDEKTVKWNLYENAKIELGVDPRDCYFGIEKLRCGKANGSITHWHPTSIEIYDEVCKIGKRGNVLVIGSFGGGAGVLYMGNKEDCPYSPDQKYRFRKLYYLEAK